MRGIHCPSCRPFVRPPIRPSVRPYVRKLYLVRIITRHRFELESPNLQQTCILGYSLFVLKIEVIDLDFQGHFGHFDLEFEEIRLVRMITRHRFELESPNLQQACILGYSRQDLKIEVIDPDLQGHFGHFDSEFYEIRLVCMITRHIFALESPNLHQSCIMGYSRLVLKMEVIDLDLQCHSVDFDLEF